MHHEEHLEHERPEPNITIEEIERLQTDRSYRDLRRSFFAEGVRNFVQAVSGHLELRVIVSSERLLTAVIARKLVREQGRLGVPTLRVSPEVFRRVSRTRQASGVGAILTQRWTPLHKASPRAGLCWIVLENVRSAGNLGSLIRSSEAIGGAGFILVGDQIDPFDPAVVRSSMGAHFRQSFIRTNYQSLRHWLRRHACQAIGAVPEGPVDFQRCVYPRPSIVFLGEERRGLTPMGRSLCPIRVRVPMTGTADSLNLAVAGSLFLYELHRQRAGRGPVAP